ncbi:MAG: hypothetical protein HY075_06675 [Deltaproteobacteria bacterium]|nr:hypothetical protein [Deltaproteobacteria bacterium]
MASGKLTRAVLVGASGRMGAAIADVVSREFGGRVAIVATIDKDTAAKFPATVEKADAVIDVSAPAATEKFLQELGKAKAKVAYVIGCTGWTDAQLKAVHKYAERGAVVLAPNFSPGVNLFLGLVEQAAPLLAKWGYDVMVHETHHTRKVDAPSGTAKAIVERLGKMKAQVHATRAGNIVGTHEVRFIGPSDILEFSHEALDRSIFARGAVMAAQWAHQQPKPGLYSMKEVIFD